jgi:hypothetical protein
MTVGGQAKTIALLDKSTAATQARIPRARAKTLTITIHRCVSDMARFRFSSLVFGTTTCVSVTGTALN